jgi:hypothetical protein
MIGQLTDSEWELVVELLEREQRDLPVELHHTLTSSRELRAQLQERKQKIDRILGKIDTARTQPIIDVA